MGKRIIFFGTPEFASICLSKILENKFELVAVVTAPDKPSGRGKKITFSAVKKLAEKNGWGDDIANNREGDDEG